MDTLLVTYEIQSDPADIQARAQAVAVEQSVEMPVQAIRDRQILDEIVGQVESVDETGPNTYRVQCRFAAATTGFEAAQFVNVLFGNTSLQESVRLVDAELPASLLAAFSGPRAGIAGLRAMCRAPRRPLTCTALKPQGSSPAALAALCKTFALAGIDVIKDDHGLANQSFSPFAERVQACQAAVEEAFRETGVKTYYAPNLSGGARQLREQAQIAQDMGVEILMVAPMLVGLPTFYELVSETLRVPVLGHPALAGAARIAPAFLFGKLFRLFGCDVSIFPNYGGRFAYSQAECTALAQTARAPWGDLLTTMPSPAGGMTVDRVGEMIDFYGLDTMLLIGGGLYTAGDALLRRAQEFVVQVARSGEAA